MTTTRGFRSHGLTAVTVKGRTQIGWPLWEPARWRSSSSGERSTALSRRLRGDSAARP